MSDFREFLFPLDHPRVADARGMDPRAFGKVVGSAPLPAALLESWRRRSDEPFHGLTCDGHCEHGLYKLADEGAPTGAMVEAAQALLRVLDEPAKNKLRFGLDAPEWRRWSNPEFLVNDNGLRLEDLDEGRRKAVLAVVEASLSARGYAKTRDCMRMNAFLGELTQVPTIMNEWSYNFLLFGEPTSTTPWGWSLYGHHVALNCFVLGRQMVITPTFLGAEPAYWDTGPYKGKRLFVAEESVGLSLMRSLPAASRQRATIYQGVDDPAVPEGRNRPGDQWHLGGAFQDNVVVPYEGIPIGDFDRAQRDKVMQIAAAFLEYLPETPLKHRLSHIESMLSRSYWSWIGGHGDDDPFYYRIQSPVVMLEFDHHAGVWLTNQKPDKCHIHTVVRTPNGNDYGRDLLRQHYEHVHPGHAPGRN